MTPQQVDEDACICPLAEGEEVNFYQVIPLYQDEMEYKIRFGAGSLLELYDGVSFVVDPERPNILEEAGPAPTQEELEAMKDRMDDAQWHLRDLRDKHLPVDEITAYNHMAIYLRWNLEHDQNERELPCGIRGSDASVCRGPCRNRSSGLYPGSAGRRTAALDVQQGRRSLLPVLLRSGDAPYFPSDIDDYALRRFGPEEYFSEKYQNETYLFIPFDEVYYQDMARLIQQRWDSWLQYEPSDEEPSELAQAMMQYLGCDCEYFPPMRDDDPITAAYSYARRRGMEEGFLPVLVAVDETLWEMLILNADPESDGAEDYGFDPIQVAKYRKAALSAAPLDGKTVLQSRMNDRISELEDDDMSLEEITGTMEGGEPGNRFLSYWDYDTRRTCPLILAKIPVKNPWEVFAYLPFGGWNECPDTAELMAIARYWLERYGAVPAVITHDVLECALPAPVPADQAMELAMEQYAFCPDAVDQGPEDASIGWLADTLRQSDKWFFWWD